MDLDFRTLHRFKVSALMIISLIPEWANAYQVPEDAIKGQIYTAHAWCNSNPKKAPKKQITRFLWSWMGAAKRYGNLKTPEAVQRKVLEPLPEPDMTFEQMQEITRQNMPQLRGGLKRVA